MDNMRIMAGKSLQKKWGMMVESVPLLASQVPSCNHIETVRYSTHEMSIGSQEMV